MRNQILKSRRSAAQSLLGGMALASLTAACIWLALDPALEGRLLTCSNVGSVATFQFSVPMHRENNTR
jgi:hypothetical protein